MQLTGSVFFHFILSSTFSILARLGGRLGSFLVILYWFLFYFVTNEVFEQIRCQEATWADLGTILGAKRLQNGRRGGSKSELR